MQSGQKFDIDEFILRAKAFNRDKDKAIEFNKFDLYFDCLCESIESKICFAAVYLALFPEERGIFGQLRNRIIELFNLQGEPIYFYNAETEDDIDRVILIMRYAAQNRIKKLQEQELAQIARIQKQKYEELERIERERKQKMNVPPRFAPRNTDANKFNITRRSIIPETQMALDTFDLSTEEGPRRVPTQPKPNAPTANKWNILKELSAEKDKRFPTFQDQPEKRLQDLQEEKKLIEKRRKRLEEIMRTNREHNEQQKMGVTRKHLHK